MGSIYVVATCLDAVAGMGVRKSALLKRIKIATQRTVPDRVETFINTSTLCGMKFITNWKWISAFSEGILIP
jgi:hypothetical protein